MEENNKYHLVREDILGGLKSATERGESLEKAMKTFHNAGYKKEDIEEAAQSFQKIQNTISQTSIVEKTIKPLNKIQPQVTNKENDAHKTIQKISNYGKEKPKSGNKILILGAIFIALFLIGSVIIGLLFKEELINLIKNFLG